METFNREHRDKLLTGLGQPLGVESPGSGSTIRGHDPAKPVNDVESWASQESEASTYSTVPTCPNFRRGKTINW